MKYPALFKPGKIGTMELCNRIVMLPMNLLLTEGNQSRYTKRNVDYFAARARGGVGLIITGHTKAENKLDPYLYGSTMPSLDEDYLIRDLPEVADAFHFVEYTTEPLKIILSG